jgi:hypothetical protein
MRDEELKSFPWRSWRFSLVLIRVYLRFHSRFSRRSWRPWRFNMVIDSLGVLAVQFRIGFVGVYRRPSAAKLVLDLIRVYLRLNFLFCFSWRPGGSILSPERPC